MNQVSRDHDSKRIFTLIAVDKQSVDHWLGGSLTNIEGSHTLGNIYSEVEWQ